eukprot:11991637-Alexandrium_andersonii.AAC.1
MTAPPPCSRSPACSCSTTRIPGLADCPQGAPMGLRTEGPAGPLIGRHRRVLSGGSSAVPAVS